MVESIKICTDCGRPEGMGENITLCEKCREENHDTYWQATHDTYRTSTRPRDQSGKERSEHDVQYSGK